MRKIDPGFLWCHPIERTKEIGDVVLPVHTVVCEDDLWVFWFQVLSDLSCPDIGLPEGRSQE